MEKIPNERLRLNTFKKRKKSLFKKAYEFSTLCAVDTAVIVFEPDGTPLPEIWPENSEQVLRVIEIYQKSAMTDRRKTCDLSDFFTMKKKKINMELNHTRKEIRKDRYSTWDDSFDDFSLEQLLMLLVRLEGKIEAASNQLSAMKLHQAPSHLGYSKQVDFANSFATESYFPHLPPVCQKPLDTTESYFPHLPLVCQKPLDAQPFMPFPESQDLHRLAISSSLAEATEQKVFRGNECNQPYRAFGASEIHLIREHVSLDPYMWQGSVLFNNVNLPTSFYTVAGPGEPAPTLAGLNGHPSFAAGLNGLDDGDRNMGRK